MTTVAQDVETIEAKRVAEEKKQRNVHQRKLAVMARCDAIVPDSKYDAPSKSGGRVRFDYNSIQAISNHIRKFAVEEGLDITCSGGDHITVEMVNVDKPDEKIVATWPMVIDDKAWAYSTKFALIRTFLIGDGTEGDEAELATRSSQGSAPASNGHSQPEAVPPPGRKATASGPVFRTEALDETGSPRICPNCGSGMEAVLWDSGKAQISCNDWKDCKYKEAASIPLMVAIRKQAEVAGAIPKPVPGGTGDLPF